MSGLVATALPVNLARLAHLFPGDLQDDLLAFGSEQERAEILAVQADHRRLRAAVAARYRWLRRQGGRGLTADKRLALRARGRRRLVLLFKAWRLVLDGYRWSEVVLQALAEASRRAEVEAATVRCNVEAAERLRAEARELVRQLQGDAA